MHDVDGDGTSLRERLHYQRTHILKRCLLIQLARSRVCTSVTFAGSMACVVEHYDSSPAFAGDPTLLRIPSSQSNPTTQVNGICPPR